MIAVIQRVQSASVAVSGETVGSIQQGLLVLAGFCSDDTPDDGRIMAGKIAGVRLFNDSEGRMNKDVAEVGGSVLAVSQFTLLGDMKKGRRPSFQNAAPAELAADLMNQFVDELRRTGLRVETGRFQTHMEVSLLNDGPVTLILDSQNWRKGPSRASPAASDQESKPNA